MDTIDNKIIEILQENGRISHEEISRKLNLSRPAIHQRIAKLEEKKIISGYTVKINWDKLGYNVSIIVSLKVHTDNYYKLIEDIMKLKIQDTMIEECYRATGEWCILLKIRTMSTKNITKLHDVLLRDERIIDTSTVLLLSNQSEDE